MLLALPKIQCYSLASVSLACYAVVYNSLKMALAGCACALRWVTRHYGDVREPVSLDSYSAVNLTRLEQDKLIHRLIINTFGRSGP